MKARCLTVAFLLSLAAIAGGFALLSPAAGLIVGGAMGAYVVTQLDGAA